MKTIMNTISAVKPSGIAMPRRWTTNWKLSQTGVQPQPLRRASSHRRPVSFHRNDKLRETSLRPPFGGRRANRNLPL